VCERERARTLARVGVRRLSRVGVRGRGQRAALAVKRHSVARGKEEREEGDREKKRRREIRGDDRDGRSHVGDKRPRDAGWDGGGEKREEYGQRRKGMERQMKSGVGTAETSGEIRV